MVAAGALAVTLAACSSTRHVPQGQYLVDKVNISVEDNTEIDKAQLVNYLRQTPNHKVLGFLKLQLATYNISGQDSTKWYNRWMRKLGQAPVIYSQELTDASVYQLHQAMVNKGYLNANVTVDTVHTSKNRKIKLDYRIHTGLPHYIATIDYAIPDTAIASLIAAMPSRERLKPGDALDRNRLEEIRTSISTTLRNNGYYAFSKDYITFVADTAAGARDVNLTLNLRQPSAQSADKQHLTYIVNKVVFVTDYNPGTDYGNFAFSGQDTVRYRDINVLYGNDRYLRPQVLYEALHITPGKPFSQRDVDRTYEALGRFGILRYVNINMQRVGTSPDGHPLLDAYVLLTRGKKQGVSLELEGTNSEGDLGFGVGVTYQHRNLAHGSELLSAKFRTSYESLSGDFNGLINNRYMEYAGEVGITFPQFEAPLLSYDFKRHIKATTEFSVSFNYQERPEYTRIIAGAGWKYRWTNRQNTLRHRFDLLDVNYVYLPKSTIDFLNQIAPTNPLLRYSYEDHFILRAGYSYYRTNKRQPSENTLTRMIVQPSVFTFRANFEPAGNLLYAISWLTNQKRHDDAYRIFGIQYAQYMKADADYTFTRVLGPRTSVSFHAGFGIGVPYGNSQMLPFEKRFYAGGANSVRGWGVRTLGPGRYASKNSVTDFINQCGDIRLDLNVEYRAKLFWILEGALFIDGGNIWTIHNYENQPGGFFRINSFYKELAAAYGVGIRLDFTYFLLRLDLGMKAVNPALDEYQWPIIHPRWGRDATIHFSVGYPF
jgi:outer membrane protein assembly factor BamA